MNSYDRDELSALKIEVHNNTKQLEKITTNDLPHIWEKVCKNSGKLSVVIPLVILILGLIVGLYFM